MLAASRGFTLEVDGEPESLLVPFGDMFNTKVPENAIWSYSRYTSGFEARSIRRIAKDEQIYITYGQKSNYAFFLYYGLVMFDINGINSKDEILVQLDMLQNQTKNYYVKTLITDQSTELNQKTFRLEGNLEMRAFR